MTPDKKANELQRKIEMIVLLHNDPDAKRELTDNEMELANLLMSTCAREIVETMNDFSEQVRVKILHSTAQEKYNAAKIVDDSRNFFVGFWCNVLNESRR